MVGVTSVTGSVGYPAIFLLILGESAGLPIPGESSLMVGSVAASKGSLSIELVLATAIAAAIIGDNLGYLAGRRFGRRIWTAGRLGRRRREQWLEETDKFFDEHGSLAVVVARWLPVARFTVAWLAGINGMPWRRFFLWNAVGGASWAVSIGVIAYVVGSAAQGPITALGFLGLAGLLIAAAGHLVWRRRWGRSLGTSHS